MIPVRKMALSVAFGLPLLLTALAAPRDTRHPGRNGALTEHEEAMARIAWRYFENNRNPSTCLVNAVDNYPSTTMWDAASSLGALVSARDLGLVEEQEFHDQLHCLLSTLESLPLFDGELPNKAYDTRTATMATYANEPGEIGYSALDLGRLLAWLRILVERDPHYDAHAQRVLGRWNFCNVIDRCGTLYGAATRGTGVVYLQEGRLGYEEYAAKGFQLWGFKTTAASSLEPYLDARIEGVDVPYDARDPRMLGAHNYVVTESYALDGLEFNWDLATDRHSDDDTHTDPDAAEFAARIYAVQAARHASTGQLTARTEHQLDQAPWFVYDTVYSDGYPWNTLTDDGRYLPASAAVSLKAAFSLWALWQTPYTDLLHVSTRGRFDPARGYYEGIYEETGAPIRTFTANNNGIILEALAYKVRGKLLRFAERRFVPWPATVPDESALRCQGAPRQRAPCGATAARP